MKVDIVKIRVDDNLGTTPKMAPEIYQAVIDEAHKKGCASRCTSSTSPTPRRCSTPAPTSSRTASATPRSTRRHRDAEAARRLLLPDADARGVDVRLRVDAAVVLAIRCSSSTRTRRRSSALKEPARSRRWRTARSAQRYKAGLEVANRNLKKLSDAGVTIAMGTDTGPPARFQGYFELMELEMMVRAGLTPRQVLPSATRDAARCMKLDAEVGHARDRTNGPTSSCSTPIPLARHRERQKDRLGLDRG